MSSKKFLQIHLAIPESGISQWFESMGLGVPLRHNRREYYSQSDNRGADVVADHQ